MFFETSSLSSLSVGVQWLLLRIFKNFKKKFQILKSFITAFLVVRAERVTFLICMLKYEEHTCLAIKLAGREYDKHQSQKNLRNRILQLSHYTKDFNPMPGFIKVRAGYWQRIRT